MTPQVVLKRAYGYVKSYVWMHLKIYHTCTHTYTHIHTHTLTHTHTHTDTHLQIHTHTHTLTYEHTHTHTPQCNVIHNFVLNSYALYQKKLYWATSINYILLCYIILVLYYIRLILYRIILDLYQIISYDIIWYNTWRYIKSRTKYHIIMSAVILNHIMIWINLFNSGVNSRNCQGNNNQRQGLQVRTNVLEDWFSLPSLII